MDVNELNYEMIGKRIRAERIKKGWQQAELAFRSDVTSAHLSHIETGKTKLALPTIVKIANALSVSVDELLYDSIGTVLQSYFSKPRFCSGFGKDNDEHSRFFPHAPTNRDNH